MKHRVWPRFGLIVAMIALLLKLSSQSELRSRERTVIPSGDWPINLPQARLSGRMPLSIDVPDLPPEETRPWFDVHAWRAFIALNWPAASSSRGTPLQPDNPAIFLHPPVGSQTVWSNYKEAFEVFNQKDKRPAPWESSAIPVNPCPDAPRGMRVFARASMGGEFLGDINQPFSFPLIDQNKNYVYYEIRFNKAEYEFIRGRDDRPVTWLYLVQNLAAAQPLSMPAGKSPDQEGSMMLKAAWRPMTGTDDLSRYCTVQALLINPESHRCEPKLMGLVGFHIAHKLKQFPQWVWASFEQVDNVDRGHGAKPNTPISFNNGLGNPATLGGWADRPMALVPPIVPIEMRTPVQVSRLNPIPTTPRGASTVDVNKAFQQQLAHTPWQYYQLVITQWPTNATQFVLKENGGVYPKDCGQSFPENGCINVTLETYFQSAGDAAGAGGNSCMSCHYTAGKSDFSWVLQRRAHR
jgi:hypothetical protein